MLRPVRRGSATGRTLPTNAWNWEPPATAFPGGAKELDLIADETALQGGLRRLVATRRIKTTFKAWIMMFDEVVGGNRGGSGQEGGVVP